MIWRFAKYDFERLSVPNTGIFTLKTVDAEQSEEGRILRLTRVEAECSSCGRASDLSPGAGLTDLNGAGVLACPHCSTHQAISRARFEEFLRRFPSGLHQTSPKAVGTASNSVHSGPFGITTGPAP
ncbi:hypothetical protein IAE57_00780 [Stenotrophomonas sp. S48]|uniref:hypothetical protein n=1 Tax=unclassified Stenotrophomonas TaxID=196198 RepID=UPI00190095D1|nr:MULTISPECIES: hypothetical protein [unclassified Stenotrophomonas]MBK0024686.1 hypothetical protein [Stenotrophomonas sp. S48]MBK0046906.1 hypothetical protein [Stenotrophomonas sp. S49]